MFGSHVVGIDCGESMHRMVVVDESSEPVSVQWVQNRASSIRESLTEVSSKLGYLPVVVMETQGGIGSIVEGVVRELGGKLELLSSRALESVRRIEGVNYKDDTIDALLVATSKQRGSKAVREAVEATQGELVLKQLARMRNDQVNRLANLHKKLRSALVELCPQMVTKDWAGPKYMSKGFEASLRRWEGFEGLERARRSTVVKVLRKASRQSLQWCETKAEALQEAAAEILVQGELRSLLTLELMMLLDEISAKQVMIRDLESRMEKAVHEHPVGSKLLTMPGVGIVTATVLLGFVLPIARTATQDQAASYSGITPANRKSGLSDKTKIRRGANGIISKTLFNSAVASLEVSAMDRNYYDKKRRDFQGHDAAHKKATIALARQRFKTMYRIMIEGVDYDLNKLVKSTMERSRSKQTSQ